MDVCGFTFDGEQCAESGDHFCVQRADRAQAFVEEVCVHTKSVYARRPFILKDWQRDDIVRPLFGETRWSEQWGIYIRRYTVAWIELGRGNGKSELDAAIVLLLQVGDDEESAEVYGAAKDTKQAGKVGEVVKRMAELSPALGIGARGEMEYNRQSRRLIHPRTNSYYEIITSDAAGELGHNPYGAVIDEVLTQADAGLWGALRTAQGKRPWSLLLGSTTAGNDPSGFAAQQHAEMMKIMEDPSRAPHVFTYIRSLPQTDDELKRLRRIVPDHPDLPVSTDPFDEANWKWPNPALDAFLARDTLREEALEAKNDPTKENEFRQFRCGQWVSQVTRWIPIHLWDSASKEMAPNPEWVVSKLKGKRAFAGLDLSSKIDLTAWSLFFPEVDAVWWRFWIPEEQIPHLDKHLGGKARLWVDRGWLTATEGDVIDYDLVYAGIEEDCERFTVADGEMDKWSGEPVRQQVEQRTGLDLVTPDQGYGLSPALDEIMRRVKSRLLEHYGNPVAQWNAESAEVRGHRDDHDVKKLVKPERNKSGKRIDGMACLSMSLDAWMRRGQQEEPRPMRVAGFGGGR